MVWRSPGGKRLDRSFLDQDQDIYAKTYSIHEDIITRGTALVKFAFESRLNVKSVDKRSAGVYSCYIYTGEYSNETQLFLESRSYEVKLTYSPDPATNIAFFIMVGSSFFIAFIINLVSNSGKPQLNSV